MALASQHSPVLLWSSPLASKRCAAPSSLGIRACSSSSPAPPQVVLTREKGKNAKLVAALANHSIRCLELPLVKHVDGPDAHKLSTILQDHNFDWIVITSPEAGVVFLEAWKNAGNPKVRVGVVGEGTATVFHDVLQSSDQSIEIAFSPSKATGKVLASELPRLGQKSKVLYPASLKASSDIEDGLSSRGFEVTRLNTYNTVAVEEVDPIILSLALCAPVVAVASPSAIRAWVKLISRVESWDNAVACIGETTADAAKKLGLKNVHYPANPGIKGWMESILTALKTNASTC